VNKGMRKGRSRSSLANKGFPAPQADLPEDHDRASILSSTASLRFSRYRCCVLSSTSTASIPIWPIGPHIAQYICAPWA
jgi:hypothetical protein